MGDSTRKSGDQIGLEGKGNGLKGMAKDALGDLTDDPRPTPGVDRPRRGQYAVAAVIIVLLAAAAYWIRVG